MLIDTCSSSWGGTGGARSAGMDTRTDLVTFLKQQHADVRRLFEKVLSQPMLEERKREFVELRRLLAMHETAEQEVVHPAVTRAIAEGEAIARARLDEERHAKQLLAELEHVDPQVPLFDEKLRALRDVVLAHAEREETEELPRLGEVLDETHLRRMRELVRLAEALAPTRPHPAIESPVANLIAGPPLAALDRTRDAAVRLTANVQRRWRRISPRGTAKALGWFSIGLGVLEIVGAKRLANVLGLESSFLVRALGVREIASGIALLTQAKKGPYIWARVAGDALDGAVLGRALTTRKRRNAAFAIAAVSPIVMADLALGRRLGLSA
jgi:hypothetical protein